MRVIDVSKGPQTVLVMVDTGQGVLCYGFSAYRASGSPRWYIPAPRLMAIASSGGALVSVESDRAAISAAYEALGFPADFRPWLPHRHLQTWSAPRVERRPVRRPLPRGLYIP